MLLTDSFPRVLWTTYFTISILHSSIFSFVCLSVSVSQGYVGTCYINTVAIYLKRLFKSKTRKRKLHWRCRRRRLKGLYNTSRTVHSHPLLWVSEKIENGSFKKCFCTYHYFSRHSILSYAHRILLLQITFQIFTFIDNLFWQ